LVRKREGKKYLGRQRHKYDTNIKMGLKQMKGGLDSLAKERERWQTLEHSNEALGFTKGRKFPKKLKK
jgi:hypothetical protein